MQNEIANAVGALVGTPPDILLAECIKASFDFRKIGAAKKRTRIGEECYIETDQVMPGS